MPHPLLLALALQGASHMDAMDAYFSCLFATVRAERRKGSDPRHFEEVLGRSCLAEEATLRTRSIDLFRSKGRSAPAATVETDRILAEARENMLGLYGKVIRSASGPDTR